MANKPIKIDIGHQEFDCEVGYYIVPITSLYVLIEDLKEFIIEKVKVK